MKNLNEKINMNIKDSLKKVTLNGVDIYWKFSMESMYDLLYDFGYENEKKLMESINYAIINQDPIPVMQIFYSGIVWDVEEEKTPFRVFLRFIDIGDSFERIIKFLEENLMDYLPNPSKKKLNQ